MYQVITTTKRISLALVLFIKILGGLNMFEFDEVIEFDETKYEDNIARHTFPEHQGKGVDADE